MTVGILVEKPSAARAFASALGGMSGTYQGVDYVITHARGHLYELAQPEDQLVPGATCSAEDMKSWEIGKLPWDVSQFTWGYVPMKGVSELLRDIKKKLSAASEIVIACDVDPSGEGGLIATNVIKGLGLQSKHITRMYFTDEAPVSLQKAFVARKHIPDIDGFDEYLMASYRDAWDFTSIQWTRLSTAAAAQAAVLRQGRLKSAMVNLVGAQLEAYNSYVKTPMYQNRFRDENGVLYTDPEEPKFATEAEVPKSYGPSKVVHDKSTNKSTAPRRLLDLAGLSARLSGKGVKADQVLAVYQKMYEDQVVSYPRTEDKTITMEQFNELLPFANQIAAVVGVDTGILTHRQPRRTHVKDTGAHGANRPGLKVPASLDALKAKYGPVAPMIYEELARSYLAMLAEDYLYELQEGHLEAYPSFLGRVSVPKSQGWKVVFFDADDASDDDDAENTAGLGQNADPLVYEIIPPRPEHPSMKWLMKQLEKRDVGTGATRTNTYAEVTNEKAKFPLLLDKRGKITMSEYGDMSYRLLPGTRIGDLGVTERVYETMRAIAAGKANAAQELAAVADWIREDISTMQANAATMRKELGLSEVRQRKEKHEGVWAVTGQVVKFNKEWSGHEFTTQELDDLLAGKQITFTATSARTGNTFEATGKLENLEYNGSKYVGFKADFGPKKDAQGNELPPPSWCGHTFTADELSKLQAGEKLYIDDFVSKAGKEFAATVHFGQEKGKKGKRIIPEFG